MAGKSDVSLPQGVAVIGNSVAAIQVALTLAQMGIEVKVITNSVALGWNSDASDVSGDSSLDQRFLYPLLVQAATHPLITLYTGARIESIKGKKGDFKIQVVQHPRYVYEDICTGCGRCEAECAAKVTLLVGNKRLTHSAIHKPLQGTRAVPSTYVIDKDGVAPCQASCPLGINIQGFISLLAKGKTDKALALINESAPLAGILGRVCKSPCEDNCNRDQVDNAVFIRALHRYAADNATSSIKYNLKFPPRFQEGKIAIVGSGPAGLTAAWELTRLGYSPVIFESHGVIGGMLATGIPRFRLPREVREREIEAIKNMGIDIRTGITVGRDVTFSYLKERGYRAFFLAIGAQQNSKLNIPGEDLEGVMDCMPLLLTLNLKVDTFVGTRIVVIGDGNSAIDSARAANRRNEGTVKILSWTIPEEITAAQEEVEEALQEKISIEYRTIPVEILGDGGRVTAIRCQRTRLSDDIMANGLHRPEPIPDTDFVIDADHVVVAIGQLPNSSQLDIESLVSDGNTGVIQVNPLTLETSIPGLFAGGDCITGPNNVVEAMAAGLRAAESIDRYLQGKNLEAGRSLEPPQGAEINLEAIEVEPYERASMPVLRLRKRINSFEETTTGLSAEAARKETQRCLNCGLCSQCMECVRVCELGAVFHDDTTRHFEMGAQVILNFSDNYLDKNTIVSQNDQETIAKGVHIVSYDGDDGLTNQVMQAMAVAMESTIELKSNAAKETQVRITGETDTNLEHMHRAPEQVENGPKRIGVFLCSCGGATSSVINFKTLTRKLSRLPGIIFIREIAQACTEDGAKQIASQLTESQLDRLVLAACRCCNSEQICYSCTDRRKMCQQYLNQSLASHHNTIVEFVNIREQCAWAHKDTPKSATRKAVQIISAGIARVRAAPSIPPEESPILASILIIGAGLASISAAKALSSRGYRVEIVAQPGSKQVKHEYGETYSMMLNQLRKKNISIKDWPDALKLEGSPGNYQALLVYDSQIDRINAGALLVNMDELDGSVSSLLCNTKSDSSLLSRILSRINNPDYPIDAGRDLLQGITIKETSGIFLVPPDGSKSSTDQIIRGLATAARVSTYLEQASLSPRVMSVNIDSKLCRGCGDCADVCSYIEMRKNTDGLACAYIDKTLCLGCGACIAICPAGAIKQPFQSDSQIISALRSMLRTTQMLSEV